LVDVYWRAFEQVVTELTPKNKALLAKRGFDPVLGARPLRRTIQREIEDALSEKILFDEIKPGQIVTVGVENWDGEGSGEDAKFIFSGSPKPRVVEDADLAGAGASGSAGVSPLHSRRPAPTIGLSGWAPSATTSGARLALWSPGTGLTESLAFSESG